MIQKVLQNLLAEGVHIRDMRTIVETLSEYATQTQDANELTAFVRIQLGRAIVQQLFPSGNEVTVMSLDNNLERLLMQALQNNNNNRCRNRARHRGNIVKTNRNCGKTTGTNGDNAGITGFFAAKGGAIQVPTPCSSKFARVIP